MRVPLPPTKIIRKSSLGYNKSYVFLVALKLLYFLIVYGFTAAINL